MNLFFKSPMFKWILMLLMISIIIFSIACFFVKSEPSREMKSKFESGIDQNEQESIPFYMHFFYIGILFLLFDVEVVLSIPMLQSSLQQHYWTVFWVLFLMIMFLGLILEISIDSVEWKE